jgi:hypothetical protein
VIESLSDLWIPTKSMRNSNAATLIPEWSAAEEAAEKKAAGFKFHGRSEEFGYWWGRTEDGQVTRFAVRPAGEKTSKRATT